jgi:tetratricopeptide (TPR) repeat protein
VKALACVVLMLAVRISAAQPPPPAEADNAERAKAADRSAREHYDLRQYAAAIEDYRRAFEALPDPLFLFDIAQAYRQIHDCDNAITFYRNYLRERPDADNRAKVEEFIAELTPCTPASSLAPPPAPTPAAPAPILSSLQIGGIAAAALGAGIVGAGIYFSFQAQNDASQLEAACAGGCTGSSVANIDREGHDANRDAIASYVVGGAVIAAGAGVFLWATFHVPGEPPIVVPVQGGGTVSARVRF